MDRRRPSDDDLHTDIDLLRSRHGTEIVAWFWPTADYRANSDPFELADTANREFQTELDMSISAVDARLEIGELVAAVDRQREQRRQVAATRFAQILEATANAVSRSAQDVVSHLKWSVQVSSRELEGLLRGLVAFPVSVVVSVCDALQLEFDDGWILADPRRLARRVDHSVRASRIADRLAILTFENLDSVEKRLPRKAEALEVLSQADSYLAPDPGGRYASLYEYLAKDARVAPHYTLSEIDEVLRRAGELALPESAKHRSWWAGHGNRAEGRPQISAWWGAGYRVGRVVTDPSTTEVVSVEFLALPGRAEWRGDRARSAQRGFVLPGAEKVRIDLTETTTGARRQADLDQKIAALASQFDFDAFRIAIAPVLASLEALHRAMLPDDPDLRVLTKFLDSVGEANRADIERHLTAARGEAIDAAWMANLLTRARRNGWIANKGTRKQSRWAAVRSRQMMLGEIADNLRLDRPKIGPDDPVPLEFFQRVAEAVEVPSDNASVVQIAQRIVEREGGGWQQAYESADGSVTSLGLRALREAIGTRMPLDE